MKTPRFFLPFLAAGSLVAQEADFFPAVAKLVEDRCLDCHSADDPDGKFSMEKHEDILKGGESGAAVKAGDAAGSLLVRYLRGEVMKDGKKRFMPPGKRDKLSAEEVEAFVKWIDAGAKPPQRAMERKVVEVPRVEPKTAPRMGVNALAFSAKAGLLAAGRHGVVELIDPASQAVVRKLEGLRGPVNALVWSEDGARLFAASGENAMEGQVRQWRAADWSIERTLKGHRDTIYALALSPDGATLATGSYDQKIKLWNVADGTERRTLSGHNGAVFGLAFRPDGKILASASADRTVKLWDVASGERRDTLSQPQKEQFAVAWSADGKRLAAAGADNRIRLWTVSAQARETTNPMAVARYAHEQAILRLVWSADGARMLSSAQDGTVRLWDAKDVKELLLLEKQPDWPTALTFSGERLVAGRADGTVGFYDAKTGRPVAAPKTSAADECPEAARDFLSRALPCQNPRPAKAMKPAPAPKGPAISGIAPRGMERGKMLEVRLVGANLPPLVSAKCADARLRVFTGTPEAGWVPLVVHAPGDLPRGAYDIIASGADGKEFGRATLRVEDIPVFDFPATESAARKVALPLNVWGTLSKAGESDRYEFEARAGSTVIFDCRAKGVGSKSDAVLHLVDARGRVLASNNTFDASGDPFIVHTFAQGGRHAVVVSDALMAGGADRGYSLTMGELPFVVGVFPLAVAAGAETRLEWIGYNLPPAPESRSAVVKAEAGGVAPVKIDSAKFRSRAPASLPVSEVPCFIAGADTHSPGTAQKLDVPFSVSGRRLAAGQDDYFRFTAKKGVTYAMETHAASAGSPMDTKISVLNPDGRAVERLLMQAVRDSAITFRPVDSMTPDVRVENWREMELNEFMWMQGEVTKIFRMPEGPDSGFQFYANAGKRIGYFDTTPTAHALDEPCYIVEPHPPGAKLVANGLPVFTLHYENDDDGAREAGTDSRLLFTAPADGDYLVRVRDSRGGFGERHAYRLVVREARPDFTVTFADFSGSVNAGSGQAFTLVADRKDGFDGEIVCEITDVPPGWHVTTPLIIQAGHLRARGSISALPGAGKWTPASITATAEIGDRKVIASAGRIANVKLDVTAPLVISMQPAGADHSAPAFARAEPGAIPEIVVAPGEIVPAWIVTQRGATKSALRFDVENLPHGVVVDNLGLNGITLLEGQDAGEIFIKAAGWVRETDRLATAVCREAGKQASMPVLIRVREKRLTSGDGLAQ